MHAQETCTKVPLTGFIKLGYKCRSQPRIGRRQQICYLPRVGGEMSWHRA
jgi:hypothetical protein